MAFSTCSPSRRNVLQAILDAGVSAGAEGGVASSIERFARALESGVWPLLPKIGVATVRMVDAIDRWPTIVSRFDRFLTVAIERLTHIAEREQAAATSVATSAERPSPRCSSRWRWARHDDEHRRPDGARGSGGPSCSR
jgi:hypothetical protein